MPQSRTGFSPIDVRKMAFTSTDVTQLDAIRCEFPKRSCFTSAGKHTTHLREKSELHASYKKAYVILPLLTAQ